VIYNSKILKLFVYKQQVCRWNAQMQCDHVIVVVVVVVLLHSIACGYMLTNVQPKSISC